MTAAGAGAEMKMKMKTLWVGRTVKVRAIYEEDAGSEQRVSASASLDHVDASDTASLWGIARTICQSWPQACCYRSSRVG
jgi:hypothetical protein